MKRKKNFFLSPVQYFFTLRKLLNKSLLAELLPLVIVFLASMVIPLDPDLGWHIRYGEYYITHHTMEAHNLFSTEMPHYQYVNTAWGNDVLMYLVFHFFGFLGISLLGALLITSIFYFLGKTQDMKLPEKIFLFPFLYLVLYLVTGNSLRDQFFTLLGIVVLYYIIGQFEKKRTNFLYFIIPLFLIWANLHGEFILGYGLYTLWTITYLIRFYCDRGIHNTIQAWKVRTTLYFCWAGAGLVTLINPYGLGLYQEVIRYANNPLRAIVVEWTPVELYSLHWWYLIIWGMLLIVNIFILFKRKDIIKNIFFIITTAFLYSLSFHIRRYMAPMFLISIPLMIWLPQLLYQYKRLVYYSACAIIICFFVTYYSLFIFSHSGVTNMSWEKYCLHTACSPQSAEFLIQHHYAGKIFTFYNWGGWLIWNYPQIKPSVDGRMTFWIDSTGYSAFAQQFLLNNNFKDINKTNYSIVYIPPYLPLSSYLIYLTEKGEWSLVYHDRFALIFVKTTPK